MLCPSRPERARGGRDGLAQGADRAAGARAPADDPDARQEVLGELGLEAVLEHGAKVPQGDGPVGPQLARPPPEGPPDRPAED